MERTPLLSSLTSIGENVKMIDKEGGTDELTKKTLHFDTPQKALALYANNQKNLSLIESKFDVSVVARDTFFKIEGSDKGVSQTIDLFRALEDVYKQGQTINDQEFVYALNGISNGNESGLKDLYDEKIQVASKKKFLTPKTKGQKEYVQTIRKNDVVFGVGPAGTGKTYLAMAMAVEALIKGEVQRVILARPAVESGETLGFLPGDLYEKITPYLRPLYDALYDMMEVTVIERYIAKGIIEIAPLAYMRGRTLNDSFIILDEAQNSTIEQMKMFLTRLGFGSKAVITGDVTQIDLPTNKDSGLVHVRKVLKGIPGIEFTLFTEKDVVRHSLVQKIIQAYEKYTQEKD